MFRRTINLFTVSVIALVVVTGCSETGGDSHFVFSDQTKSLIKEARVGMKGHDGVTKLVNDRFGTPQKLKIWSKLPLNAGGVSGVVAENPDESAAVKSLKLQLNGELETSEDHPIILQIVSGEAAGEFVTVEHWSDTTSVAELTAPMTKIPKAGDEVVIGAGELLQNGRQLYMRHCSHCHGTSGDGAGPTAEYLYPRPRDYRKGLFKFTSTKSLRRPSRDDLERILTNGIPGTYMPSFVPMLKSSELDAVVEYIRFLSMRGEFEGQVGGDLGEYTKEAVAQRIKEKESRSSILSELRTLYEEEMPDNLEFNGDSLAQKWTEADDVSTHVIPSVPRTKDTIDSRRRGRAIFIGATLNCVNCHGINGEGDGPQTREYEIVEGKPRPNPGLHDDWGHLVKPRNLRTGIYRGGRRPIDLFRRLYTGINGAKMPAFGGKVPDEQLWDVVNYVLSIPFDPKPGHIPAKETPAVTASR